MKDVVWEPDPEVAAATNVGRFMADEGIATFDELLQRSIDEPEWFWDAVVRFLGLPFAQPYSKVLDTSDGIPFARWFVDGQINLATACVDRWAEETPDALAVIWEGEDGETRELTYTQLRAEVDACAHLLEALGVKAGQAVGIFLPMVPETVAACMAVAKMGAVFLPIFSGYGAEAVGIRLADGGAVAVVTADGCTRRAKPVDMLSTAIEAADLAPTVHTIVVVPRLGRPLPDDESARLVAWPANALAHDAGAVPYDTRVLPSEATLFVAYTSGTTGRPKGSVHAHAGFLVKIAEEVAFQFDCRRGDRLFWLADFGWIMGPWEIVGTLANGATVCLYDGAPDYPDVDRLWAYLERHAVTILGISPTLIRAMMQHGEEPVRQHDLSKLRILGSTGEPWNLEPWQWYFDVVGRKRCPIINISGGTEVGACFLSPHPVQPLTPMTLGGPSLGMAVDVFDDEGKPVREAVGELVCTKPWPAMTRSLFNDRDRYLETYWSRWPDVWVHGDWASIEDGQWYLHGRSDDTIKIAGKRLGPAEAESAAVSHPAVVEAAAVGMPHEIKGEELWVYVVRNAAYEASDEVRAEIKATVSAQLGKSFAPSKVLFTRALPKTRSAKVLRRAIRATALGVDAGDLSSLEDPTSIDAIREAE